MAEYSAIKLNVMRKFLLSLGGCLAMTALVVIGFLDGPAIRAQSVAAEMKLAFDVAAVRQNKSDSKAHANFPLGPGDSYFHTGGIFSASNLPLVTYIAFAYKLTSNQIPSLLRQLPEWVSADRFNVEARAEGEPTKDEMCLMMQTLLADRFKLKVHNEVHQVHVLALVLSKPGRTGPSLQPHPMGDSSCSSASLPQPATDSASSPPAKVDGDFPVSCGGLVIMPVSKPDSMKVGARNVSMEFIASSLSGMGGLDRPVINQTGLKGTFDFVFEYARPRSLSAEASSESDVSDPTFLEALKEQLGLKLNPATAPVEVLLVDHIEPPSEN